MPSRNFNRTGTRRGTGRAAPNRFGARILVQPTISNRGAGRLQIRNPRTAGARGTSVAATVAAARAAGRANVRVQEGSATPMSVAVGSGIRQARQQAQVRSVAAPAMAGTAPRYNAFGGAAYNRG